MYACAYQCLCLQVVQPGVPVSLLQVANVVLSQFEDELGGLEEFVLLPAQLLKLLNAAEEGLAGRTGQAPHTPHIHKTQNMTTHSATRGACSPGTHVAYKQPLTTLLGGTGRHWFSVWCVTAV